MGLTFQQQFYNVPEEVYVVHTLEPGDFADGAAIFGIIEVPEDKDEDFDLNCLFEGQGYWLDKINFNELVREGYDLLKELKAND